jgi:hypothetical protein
VRQVAAVLLDKYVPSNWGDPAFQEIINGDYQGGGTTCGFLAHWLLWRIGCRTRTLVNRTDAESGLSYVIGRNISRLRWNAFFKVYGGGLPGTGDIVFTSNGPPNTEHVFCFLRAEGDTWISADAGQTNPADGRQCARIRRRTFKNGSLTSELSTRKIQGWLPLDRLILTAPATLCGPQ